MQDRSEVFPPDNPTAMGADAGFLCLCALYVLTHFISPEISLESGDCPDLLSPTRLPQVCAECMHRMAGNHHTPFTAAHLHGRTDPSEKHQQTVTSMQAKQGPHTNCVSSTCSRGNPSSELPAPGLLSELEVGSETGSQGAKPNYILTDIPLQQIDRRHGIAHLNSSFGKTLSTPRHFGGGITAHSSLRVWHREDN